jgi:hypothetical protein
VEPDDLLLEGPIGLDIADHVVMDVPGRAVAVVQRGTAATCDRVVDLTKRAVE